MRSVGRFESSEQFIENWKEQVSLEPAFRPLNAHYSQLEGRSSGFNHSGRYYFGDIIELKDFPDVGYSTLLTKGMSGYQMQAPSGHAKIGVELAWTLKESSVSTEVVEALADLADKLLSRRVAPHHNEVIDFDLSVIPGQKGLCAFLASNDFWFGDGLGKISGDLNTFIFELFALKRKEAQLAEKDIDLFSEQMEANEIEPEDLSRHACL